MFYFFNNEFWGKNPFPYVVFDDFLAEGDFEEIQKEILNIPQNEFDRYSNPVEQKYTLRDKEKIPFFTKLFFEYLESKLFHDIIEETTGFSVENDPYKHYWGIHIFHKGDKLDIHVDAGRHPKCDKKKFLTFGYYLTKNWSSDFGGELEFWKGDLATKEPVAFIDKKVVSFPCAPNTGILFACSDDSWHGAPTLYQGSSAEPRIFLTLSYMLDDKNQENINKLKRIKDVYGITFENNKTRAYFPAIRGTNESQELTEFRIKRASEAATNLYRYNG